MAMWNILISFKLFSQAWKIMRSYKGEIEMFYLLIARKFYSLLIDYLHIQSYFCDFPENAFTYVHAESLQKYNLKNDPEFYWAIEDVVSIKKKKMLGFFEFLEKSLE